VRGDRPQRASIHAAWSPPANEPDRDDRDALAAFESKELATQTIVDVAPEPWMKKLAKPGLPLRWNRGLVEYLRYFTQDARGKAMMRAWLRRAGRYERKIRTILAEHGVPEDLVWVVMAESGFNPRVRSAVGAAGPWQFMEGTGGVYGLAKDYWVDERYDVERSSHAAAIYLADLHVRFGSWELALAAYNAGYGLVMTAIERNNTNNFWALAEIESGLPHATVNYVPKIVAAALVAKNRDALGFGAAEVEPLPAIEWVLVAVEKSTTLAAIAKELDVDAELLAELNAELVRGRTPPKRGPWKIRVPKARASAFAAALSKLRAGWVDETTHTVREGEKLAAIAAAHGITEKELRKQNGTLDGAEIVRGTTLVVPSSSGTVAEAEARPLVAVPQLTTGEDERLVFFAPTRASTPTSIASAFGVTWPRIVQWNDLDPQARVQPGQLLQVVVPRSFDAGKAEVVVYERDEVEIVARGSKAHLEASLARRGKARRAVKARRGDTLDTIGKRFDLTSGDLARINGYNREHALAAGELVIVYVEDGKRRGTVDAPAPRAPDRDGLDPDDDGRVEHGESELPSVVDTPRASRSKPASKRSKRRSASTASTSRVPGRPDPQ
jgi:membrane-bound lytic murein transglycosylase D